LDKPGSLQRYSYARNNPVNLTDPSGKVTLIELVATVSIMNILETALPTFVKGVALAGQVWLMRPAFEQRARGFELLALDDPKAIETGIDLIDRADRMISLRAQLVGPTIKLIDYFFIGRGVVKLIGARADLIRTGFNVTSLQYQRLTRVIQETDEFLVQYQSYTTASVTSISPQFARDFSRVLFQLEKTTIAVLLEVWKSLHNP
jgi:hypothetical protein